MFAVLVILIGVVNLLVGLDLLGTDGETYNIFIGTVDVVVGALAAGTRR